MEKTTKGFTLIELMIVIATIGLISALAYAALDTGRQKPRDAKRVADIKTIQTALDLYVANTKTGYPSTPGVALGMPAASRLCDTGWQSQATPCTGRMLLEVVPKAPAVADGSCTLANNSYIYAQTGSGTGYTLTFCLGSKVADYKAGVVQLNQDGVK